MRWLFLSLSILVHQMAQAKNGEVYDCIVEKMKGQPRSMQAIVMKSCEAKFGSIGRYVAIRGYPKLVGNPYEYVFQQFKWSNLRVNHDNKQFIYLNLNFSPLPSAPNLGAVNFKYSTKACGATTDADWTKEISISMKPQDLRSTLMPDAGIRPELTKRFASISEKNHSIYLRLDNGAAECLRITYMQAMILD